MGYLYDTYGIGRNAYGRIDNRTGPSRLLL